MWRKVLYSLGIATVSLVAPDALATLINVAPRGFSTASSVYQTDISQNAHDGLLGSMWNAGPGLPQWLDLDLGATYDIATVRARVAQSPTGDTNHRVFVNGNPVIDWSGITQDGQWLEQTFATPVSGRHLRIETMTSPSWVAWTEIEVYADTDTWVATANASYPGASPSNAIDGNYSTMWNAGPFANPWVEIDLGVPHLIDNILAKVAQAPDGNTIHKVFVDGNLLFEWNDFTVDGQWLQHPLADPIVGQRVRIETAVSPSWVAWYEILVHGEILRVPEPGTLVLFGLGLAGLGVVRRRALWE